MEPMRLLVTDAAAQPPRQATAWLIMTLGRIMQIYPDQARKEQIKLATDKFAFVGLGTCSFFLAIPIIDLGWFTSLNPFLFIGVAIIAIGPVAFALFWLERKINNRKIWWSIGTLAWISCFFLAVTGYYMK